jgi:hypothetical protein
MKLLALLVLDDCRRRQLSDISVLGMFHFATPDFVRAIKVKSVSYKDNAWSPDALREPDRNAPNVTVTRFLGRLF